jgi:hypothetical protein
MARRNNRCASRHLSARWREGVSAKRAAADVSASADTNESGVTNENENENMAPRQRKKKKKRHRAASRVAIIIAAKYCQYRWRGWRKWRIGNMAKWQPAESGVIEKQSAEA